ncbi:MAG: hypothetical protein PHX80_04340 [Candidatus Nanoarchaeia archaeon]|nr:hypothetical protein [Candidatus Nanoarchaeia archaeon]
MKRLYDGYIHENGDLIVQRMPFDTSLIDRSSPFVKRYLGPVEVENVAQARTLLWLENNKIETSGVL